MKLKDEILNKFPFLKTKTAKYLLIFSVIRRIAVLILVLFYFSWFYTKPQLSLTWTIIRGVFVRVAGHILVFFYFITFQLSAQEIQNKLSPFDSTKQTINYPQEKMQFKNIFRNKIHKGMNQTDISNLKLYNETIDSTLSFQNFMLSYDEIITDSTEDFKKSFSLLMEYAKHNQNKYDLGEFGRYLGISRDILAIILALISVAK